MKTYFIFSSSLCVTGQVPIYGHTHANVPVCLMKDWNEAQETEYLSNLSLKIPYIIAVINSPGSKDVAVRAFRKGEEETSPVITATFFSVFKK